MSWTALNSLEVDLGGRYHKSRQNTRLVTIWNIIRIVDSNYYVPFWISFMGSSKSAKTVRMVAVSAKRM